MKSKRLNRQVCHHPHAASGRRGAAHALIASMLVAFGITIAFSIDYAYMQLIRTELRTATDAAATRARPPIRVLLNLPALVDE